jgi:hypothetical protein
MKQSPYQSGVYKPGEFTTTMSNVGIVLDSEGREEDYFNVG